MKRKRWLPTDEINGGAVAEEEDGEQSLQNDSVFQF